MNLNDTPSSGPLYAHDFEPWHLPHMSAALDNPPAPAGRVNYEPIRAMSQDELTAKMLRDSDMRAEAVEHHIPRRRRIRLMLRALLRWLASSRF